jgi:hypothetical protein
VKWCQWWPEHLRIFQPFCSGNSKDSSGEINLVISALRSGSGFQAG